MNKKDIYIKALNNIKFDENLKARIMFQINMKSSKKTINFVPKTLISLAGVQLILCVFTTNCAGCVLL